MRVDLILLSLAFAFLAGGMAHLAVAIKRIAHHAFSEALNGAASEIR